MVSIKILNCCELPRKGQFPPFTSYIQGCQIRKLKERNLDILLYTIHINDDKKSATRKNEFRKMPHNIRRQNGLYWQEVDIHLLVQESCLQLKKSIFRKLLMEFKISRKLEIKLYLLMEEHYQLNITISSEELSLLPKSNHLLEVKLFPVSIYFWTAWSCLASNSVEALIVCNENFTAIYYKE